MRIIKMTSHRVPPSTVFSPRGRLPCYPYRLLDTFEKFYPNMRKNRYINKYCSARWIRVAEYNRQLFILTIRAIHELIDSSSTRLVPLNFILLMQWERFLLSNSPLYRNSFSNWTCWLEGKRLLRPKDDVKKQQNVGWFVTKLPSATGD